jgi:hypothetical protein
MDVRIPKYHGIFELTLVQLEIEAKYREMEVRLLSSVYKQHSH